MGKIRLSAKLPDLPLLTLHKGGVKIAAKYKRKGASCFWSFDTTRSMPIWTPVAVKMLLLVSLLVKTIQTKNESPLLFPTQHSKSLEQGYPRINGS